MVAILAKNTNNVKI